MPKRPCFHTPEGSGKILGTTGKIPKATGKLICRTRKMHGLKCSYLQVTFVCIMYKSHSCIAIFACEELDRHLGQPMGNLYRWLTCRGLFFTCEGAMSSGVLAHLICSFQDRIGQGFKLSHIQGSCSFCGTELQLQTQLLELMLLICKSKGKIQGGGFTC